MPMIPIESAEPVSSITKPVDQPPPPLSHWDLRAEPSGSPAAILIGKPCRQCRALIPLSIADKMGSEENGYLCEKCQAKHFDGMKVLQSEVSEFWDKEVYVDMGAAIAPPCAKCGTIEDDERVLEDYEGRKAMLCRKCGAEYLRTNRDKIRGTKLEWDLRLK
jgi:hypothetical protein